MGLYILISVIVILVFYILFTYNSLTKSNNLVKEAFSTMDVYLKKRWDLIPNLLEVVKGYAKNENNVLEQLSSIRANSYNDMIMDKKININEQITQNLSKIMAISEKYPDLKASKNFLDLSKNLIQVEDEIANSRKYYNGTVRNYNNKIQMFPSNIVAKLLGFKEYNIFKTDEEEKINVKVNL